MLLYHLGDKNKKNEIQLELKKGNEMINIRLEKKEIENILFIERFNNKKEIELKSYFSKLSKKYNRNEILRISLFNNKKEFMKTVAEQSKESAESKIKMSKYNFKKHQFLMLDNRLVVGTKGVSSPEDWRQLAFNLVKYIRKELPMCSIVYLDRKVTIKSKQFFEGLYLADYKFNKYKSKKTPLTDLDFLVTQDFESEIDIMSQRNELLEVINEAKCKANSQQMVRDLVNTTPEDINPESMIDISMKKFGLSTNIKVEIYDEEKLQKLNMKGHLTVNRGSKYKANLIKFTYEPKDFDRENNKVILGVGKGLTYDTGGLSLKPSGAMTTMKADKSGAMTLYGLANLLSKQGSKNKVILYLPLAENAVSSESYRPDDVIVHKNGVTSHIKNTDAEGRIVLMDSLILAQEENPDFDEIFSIATLTGSAIVQFGNEAAGMVSQNEELFEKFLEKGVIEDEIFCEAKLHKFMMDGIKDNIADITNIGTPNQGCQKAALYLMAGIKKKNLKKYIHLDIAGPAFVDKAFGTNVEGATGFGLRTLFEVYTK